MSIDGFRSNKSTGNSWPNQCWNPGAAATDSWIKIDFGRDVKVNTMELLLRMGSNETFFTDAIVEFSDGTTMAIALHKSSEAMSIDLGGKVTSSLTIKGFVKSNTSASAPITEIAVFGTEA